MRTFRALAGLALAGTAGLSLAGCEVARTFAANCQSDPPAPHQEFGAVSMRVDVPVEVAAGETFTIEVLHVGVGAGPQEDPPTAQFATIVLGGAATPSGEVGLASFPQAAEFPVEVEVTATGAPGDTITVGLASATSVQVRPPEYFALRCTPSGGGHVATIRIVEPN